MRLSLQSQYAICGMFDLAYHGEEGPVQVRVIGERQRIPRRFLEQIFQRLRKAGLVRGKRGPGGGYVLARGAAQVTLLDIIEAVEGPLGDSLAPGPPPRDREVPERPTFLWPDLTGRIQGALQEVSLASLCRQAAEAGVERASAESRVWHI
ncbi:MAG: Rrf2 family transcriptional regulator [Deltaproteobacteria bacterium]|nr:Rrf2 family transcriptional regulator [Deltaproteobacteria bacterium]MBW2395024.1 Rrf2 family transcriptional regulator [Deltaproteobacteria bacterium]